MFEYLPLPYTYGKMDVSANRNCFNAPFISQQWSYFNLCGAVSIWIFEHKSLLLIPPWINLCVAWI